jgi:DNA-directed RNA polymerase subunit M/transcription elongation factor TFIIS
MNHTLREYARKAFGDALGPGVSAKNAEISVLNWSVQESRRTNSDASWENPVFRRMYRHKVFWLLTEMRRPVHAVTVSLAPVGAQVKLELKLVNQLVYRLQNKELDVKCLAKYPAEVLWPDGPVARTMFKIRARELAKEQAQAALDAAYVGMFKCRKCGKNKVTYTQAQTRSADEPMVRIRKCFSLKRKRLTPSPDNFLLLHELRQQVEGVSGIDYLYDAAFRDVRCSLVLV